MKGKSSEKEEKPVCPYCEHETEPTKPPYCQPCGVTLLYCPKCRTAVARESTACPKCGGKLEWR